MATLSEILEEANAALSAGNHERALSLALLMQRHFPRDYQTLELLGKIYLEGRKLRESRDAFGRVLEIDPENVLARAAYAIIAEEEGDQDEALLQFRRALDVDPGNHEIAAEVARLYAQLGRGQPPEPGSSVHATARRSIAEHRYENAIPWLQEALRQTPDLTDVAMGLIRAQWLARRPKEAENLAREVTVQHPDCLGALAVMAAMAVSRRDAEAETLLNRTSMLNPGNAVTRALFAEAGMDFPELEERLDIPVAELHEVLEASSDASPSTTEIPPDAPSDAAEQVTFAVQPSADGEVTAAVDEIRTRWLAGDVMAMDGQFRKAVEQYLLVLKPAPEEKGEDKRI